MLERELAIFSPIPPEQNGIADYTYHLVSALRHETRCAVYTNQPDGILPEGVPIREPLQAFRYLPQDQPILHQIGNNPGHIFVLQALRQWGGVTTLHDQNLHYLYEVSGATQPMMVRNLRATSEKMGEVFARHWFEEQIKTAANYALFDMLDEVLTLSSAVVVHSRFARNRIRLLYGEDAAARVHVIPHLALPPDERSEDYVHGTLDVPQGVPLIVTSGFATFAKRFDWLVAALDRIAAMGIDFFWVHAGKERPEEYDLSGLLNQHPNVKARSRITGYLTEAELNECIASCDILVNLRFPSVGESSGTLARAMAAGRCCVVNATAAYADLPTDAVMHIPVNDTIPALVDGLLALLGDPQLRASFGNQALSLARGEWAPEAVARAYVDLISTQTSHPPRNQPRRRIGSHRFSFPINSYSLREDIKACTSHCQGQVEIQLLASSSEQLAQASLQRPLLFQEILPNNMEVRTVNVEQDRSQPRRLEDDRYAGVALVLKGELA
ncbi:glycosyltransferase family 4 protein [Acidocella aromatica]|uniref:Glycosyltransferase involved in cell wall biosynthesis n=1 Tax=Acidocella aromatica TaxID=1303579 RepID=A0A840VAY7_9PROT|nr:glycosyltransferase family 4 protein [Acidocella aromatica]MBB5372754.1 glycosyltransferase involved in cell wall biosynthesis [Acidocella aromatica]